MFNSKIRSQICFLSSWLAFAVVVSNPSLGQNNTRKIRVQPNEFSSRIGTAVDWHSDFEKAAAKSKNTGKPLFWYVPTLPGTFMDRKVEIDRYMLAGPFSWPPIIKSLNNDFVPLRLKPDRSLQKRYELSRYKFVEPGILILKNQEVKTKIDQITTLQYDWWQSILQQYGGAKTWGHTGVSSLVTRLKYAELYSPGIAPNAEFRPLKLYFSGVAEFQAGNHEAADRIWRSVVDKFPDHPVAWKASAETQRIGPFCRGFETYTTLPAKCLNAGIDSRGTRAPAGTFSRSDLWQRGTDFLLSMQNATGGFLDSDYDFGGTDSLPNVHVAVSSLAGICLIEASSRLKQTKPAVESAIDKCFEYVRKESNLNRQDRDEILWADAYRLRFLCRYGQHSGKDVTTEIAAAARALENLQSKRGSWYHEYENSFVTATALLALADAKQVGVELDQSKIARGVEALRSERYANGAYPYSRRRGNPDGAALTRLIPGSAGRMPLCELALSKWGMADQQSLMNAIDASFQHHQNLDVALKYDNHTSTHGYGGFFFWYDMRARCEAILSVKDPVKRKEYLGKQLEIVMVLPEIDGCFVDSHELGRCYGTAMALLCLSAIETEFTQ